jgi:hypothetical protein
VLRFIGLTPSFMLNFSETRRTTCIDLHLSPLSRDGATLTNLAQFEWNGRCS